MLSNEEAKKIVDHALDSGATKEDLSQAFYFMFVDDEIGLESFEGLLALIGYGLNDEFKNMSTEEQKSIGFKDGEKPDGKIKDMLLEKEGDGVVNSDVEQSGKGYSYEGEVKPDVNKQMYGKSEPFGEDEDDDKAKKLFGLDKK